MMKKAAFLVAAGGVVGALVWFALESSPVTPSSATRWLVAPDVEAEIREHFPAVVDNLDRVAEFEQVQAESGSPGFRTVPPPFEAPPGLAPEEVQALAQRAERDGIDAMQAFFPKFYSRRFETYVHGMRARITPVDAAMAEARVQNGKLFYADAYRDTDVLYRVSARLFRRSASCGK